MAGDRITQPAKTVDGDIAARGPEQTACQNNSVVSSVSAAVITLPADDNRARPRIQSGDIEEHAMRVGIPDGRVGAGSTENDVAALGIDGG